MKKQLIISFMMVMLAIILTFPPALLAQEGRGGGRLQGTVKDETGQPLKDVKLILQSLNFNFKLETISDADGSWIFYGFGRDQFKVTATKEGYTVFEHVQPLSGVQKNPQLDIVLVKEVKTKAPEVDKAAGEKVKKGNELYKEGKYAEALPYFQTFLKENPKQYQVGINLGNVYMQLKQYEDAINAFKNVIEGFKNENPNLKGNEKAATIYASIGEAYSALNNLEEAARYYKESMALYPPKDAAVAYNVAEILFNGGMTDEAIEYYNLAASLKPDVPIYYSKLGYAYLNKGEFKPALENFEKFIKLAPDDPQTPTLKSLIEDLKQQQ
ncbi:MAG TPA: tetratricopeptide repeat protein [Candidatus Kapabacteria bacterium]|nr:tetratricopeptide repeat protein [Candidatus Kapabacteria bacterium]